MDVDVKQVYTFMKDTPIYGRFKLWHLVAFMVLGPTLTWPMLVILMMIYLYELKDVRSMFSINGDQRSAPGSSGGNQGASQGPTQGEGPA